MRFCIKLSGPIFGVKLNLHIYKTVKDFETSSLTDIPAANVCIMKKPEVSIMYLRGVISIFVPALFSEIVAILTAPAVIW